MNICGYQFEGPYHEASTNFNDVAAVYVILDTNYKMIDVGETDGLKTRLANHERRDCWEKNSRSIYVAVHKENDEDKRLHIESEIRNSSNLPCGEK